MPTVPPASEQPERGPRAAAVVLAAGDGRRSGHSTNKVLLPLAGLPVLVWSIRCARELPELDRMLVVIREQDRREIAQILEREVEPPEVEIVVGGSTRHGSEWQALQVLAPAIEAGEVDVVVVHDAARPLAGTRLWAAVVDAAAASGGAIPAEPQGHLVSRDGGSVPDHPLVAVQTPQAFAARPLLAAYRQAQVDGFAGTDTASCIERYGAAAVTWLPGDPGNLKITFADDLPLAERLLARERPGAHYGRTTSTAGSPADPRRA